VAFLFKFSQLLRHHRWYLLRRILHFHLPRWHFRQGGLAIIAGRGEAFYTDRLEAAA